MKGKGNKYYKIPPNFVQVGDFQYYNLNNQNMVNPANQY